MDHWCSMHVRHLLPGVERFLPGACRRLPWAWRPLRTPRTIPGMALRVLPSAVRGWGYRSRGGWETRWFATPGSAGPSGGRPAGLRKASGPGRSSPSSHGTAAAEVIHEPAEAGVAPSDQGVRSLRHVGDLPCRAALSNLHEPAVPWALPVSPHLQHLFSPVGGKIWRRARQPEGPQADLPLPSLASRRR